jgi:putative lipoprotein
MNKTKTSILWLITSFLMACHADGTYSESSAADMTLQGTLTYLQRIALTSNASAHVKLIDSTAKVTIAEQTIIPAGQVPIHFQLSYSSAETPSSNSYAIQASIKENGQVRFQTLEPIAINPLEPPQSLVIRLNIPQQ